MSGKNKSRGNPFQVRRENDFQALDSQPSKLREVASFPLCSSNSKPLETQNSFPIFTKDSTLNSNSRTSISGKLKESLQSQSSEIRELEQCIAEIIKSTSEYASLIVDSEKELENIQADINELESIEKEEGLLVATSNLQGEPSEEEAIIQELKKTKLKLQKELSEDQKVLDEAKKRFDEAREIQRDLVAEAKQKTKDCLPLNSHVVEACALSEEIDVSEDLQEEIYLKEMELEKLIAENEQLHLALEQVV
ncbi:hypothetical protein DSO57_1007175 [Entomophthora muscae]|uniref:Uncharacterized protein n=1 Tax=Entomophthora muscae TaxID=34485 RepID=A0ACC2U6G8_9FUNG|nr:hypothetical protein DSO57_1007175 [Entomophthora muscae]